MLAPELTGSARSRVDPYSALVHPDDVKYEVVHAGSTAVVLRPMMAAVDDLVITTADVGLMPGGLHCPPPVFAHWRDFSIGSAVSLRVEAPALQSAERVDLHLGVMAFDIEAIRRGEDLHREASVEDGGLSIDIAMVVAYHALARDLFDLEIAVLELIGAGTGSTPAGDDILVGVAAALACTGNTEQSRLIASVARTVEGRTTRASRLYLRAAADGRFAERVHRLVHGMTNVVDVTGVMSAVRTWGATSGVDLAAGVIGGLTIAVGQAAAYGSRSAG